MVIALAAIGAYVLLVGVASFIEVPVGRGLDALQLNALIRIGSAALAVAALLAVHGFSLPAARSLAAGIGIGLLAGAGSICYCFALNDLPYRWSSPWPIYRSWSRLRSASRSSTRTWRR